MLSNPNPEVVLGMIQLFIMHNEYEAARIFLFGKEFRGQLSLLGEILMHDPFDLAALSISKGTFRQLATIADQEQDHELVAWSQYRQERLDRTIAYVRERTFGNFHDHSNSNTN